MNDFWEDNKKKIIIIGIIIVLVIVGTIINSVLDNSKGTSSPEKALEELGRAYYEDVYYPALTEQYADNYKKILANYSEDGMQVTLLTLLTSIENSIMDPFIGTDTESCNLELSYVTIFPTGSYAIDEYTIETNLRCDMGIASEEEDSTNESGE